MSRVVCWASAPLLVVGALALPAASRAVSPALQASGDVAVDKPQYRPAPRITEVALIGNSVPESLITTARSSAQPDLRLIDQTHIGCDPLPAQKIINGQRQPQDPGCDEWRATWQEPGAEQDADVVLYFVAHTLVTDRMVDNKRVVVGTPTWDALIEDNLDAALSASGKGKFAIVNLACHSMPTFNNEELERVNDIRYVKIVNRTVTAWADKHDVPVIDKYSLLCAGDKMHDTVNGVPLYEDSIHFTSESGPIFWRWLAPQVQAIARGEDPS